MTLNLEPRNDHYFCVILPEAVAFGANYVRNVYKKLIRK